jgi:Transcriptional antiterminator
MRKNTRNEILTNLSKERYITSSELATKLSVSPRTIQNYIRQINAEGKVIESSNRYGYKLVSDFSLVEESLPSNQMERIFFLVKVLIQKPNGISTFDLSSELCISTSTLAKDLSSVRPIIEKYELQLKNKKGYIYLHGSETKKRRLIREIIITADKNLLSFDSTQMLNQTSFDTTDIKDIIVSTLKHNNVFVNDYSLTNLVIHASIALDRLMQHEYLLSTEYLNLDGFDLEVKIAKEICESLNQRYRVIFNKNEIDQLAFLMITKTSTINFRDLNHENIVKILGQQYLDLTNDIIKKVNHHFFVDIYDEEFILKFALHLKNVIFRADHAYQERNPLTKDFKQTYPLIYDIAVFISFELKKITGNILNEDEITFLAFHIGAIIDRKNQLSKKMKCILVYPNYYDFHRSTLKRLTDRFSEQMEIVEVTNSIVNRSLDSYDLIISASPLEITQPYTLINPYLVEKDYETIEKNLQAITNYKKKKLVYKYFNDFFKSDFFEVNRDFKDEFEAIHYMSNKLLMKGFITQDFEQGVIEREELAATSFDNGIAIPHSITTSAISNCSYVIINEKPMEWGGYLVRIIILIGINDDARYAFKDVYSNLLNIFDSDEQTERLLNCRSFSEFMEILGDNTKIY